MQIKVFNSLTNKIEEFKPLRDGEVSIYCCGPTVYGDAHVGNIRPVIVFDTLRRFLEEIGYNVKLVSNFTDVDDKIIKKAIDEDGNTSVRTEKVIKTVVPDPASCMILLKHWDKYDEWTNEPALLKLKKEELKLKKEQIENENW